MDVKKIIEIINKEGRQGPKDLKSEEVYNWVKKQLNISYNDYKKILESNAIDDSKRNENRNAFFVIDKHGKYQLFKSNEEEIRKYLCYIVRENEKITSAEVRKKFKLIYQEYTIVDLMDQKNLSSKQDIIDQTIRNILVSNYDRKNNKILFNRTETPPYKYTLTKEGYRLAEEVDILLQNHKNEEIQTEHELDGIDSIEINKGIGYYTEEELQKMFEENKNFDFYTAYDVSYHEKGRIPTDPKLKTTRFYQVKCCCESDKSHKTFKTSIFPNFLEGHHLVPISAQRNFPSINLDCIQNIVALCPNCHSKIHFGTREEKKEVFDKIVQSRKEDLEKIGFTVPILKVIFDIYY